MSSHVSERGQITIDKTVREQLGIQPGMIAYQRVVQGHLEVIFLPAPHRRSLCGALHRPGEYQEILSGERFEESIIEAVAEEKAEYERDDF